VAGAVEGPAVIVIGPVVLAVGPTALIFSVATGPLVGALKMLRAVPTGVVAVVGPVIVVFPTTVVVSPAGRLKGKVLVGGEPGPIVVCAFTLLARGAISRMVSRARDFH
jgi:hypothetical protein